VAIVSLKLRNDTKVGSGHWRVLLGKTLVVSQQSSSALVLVGKRRSPTSSQRGPEEGQHVSLGLNKICYVGLLLGNWNWSKRQIGSMSKAFFNLIGVQTGQAIFSCPFASHRNNRDRQLMRRPLRPSNSLSLSWPGKA
jgi:hypothetical protein